MSKRDQSNLLENIKLLYTKLTNDPGQEFGWEKGKANAQALGHKADRLDIRVG